MSQPRSEWIDVDDELPPVGVLVRLKLRDSGGEFEGRHLCSMDEYGEFYNRNVEPPVRIEPLVIAWRPVTPRKPRPDWSDFARVVDGGTGK